MNEELVFYQKLILCFRCGFSGDKRRCARGEVKRAVSAAYILLACAEIHAFANLHTHTYTYTVFRTDE